MQIEVKNNNFIEINDLIKISTANCRIGDYSIDDKMLKGELIIEGECFKNSESIDLPFNFSQKVPIEIMFVEDIRGTIKPMIQNFEYFEVERRGIETETTILFDCVDDRTFEATDVDNNDLSNETNEEKINETSYDIIKNEVEESINDILNQSFSQELAVEIEKKNFFPPTTQKTRISISTK